MTACLILGLDHLSFSAGLEGRLDTLVTVFCPTLPGFLTQKVRNRVARVTSPTDQVVRVDEAVGSVGQNAILGLGVPSALHTS